MLIHDPTTRPANERILAQTRLTSFKITMKAQLGFGSNSIQSKLGPIRKQKSDHRAKFTARSRALWPGKMRSESIYFNLPRITNLKDSVQVRKNIARLGCLRAASHYNSGCCLGLLCWSPAAVYHKASQNLAKPLNPVDRRVCQSLREERAYLYNIINKIAKR